jgi:hypothetical protein
MVSNIIDFLHINIQKHSKKFLGTWYASTVALSDSSATV